MPCNSWSTYRGDFSRGSSGFFFFADFAVAYITDFLKNGLGI